MASTLNVEEVIRLLNQKLDDIEKGVDTGQEEEKKPGIEIINKDARLNPMPQMISRIDHSINILEAILDSSKTPSVKKTEIIEDVKSVNKSLLDALNKNIEPIDTYTDDEWSSTKLTSKQRLEANSTKKTISRQLRLLNYDIQLTFTNEEVGNGLLVAMLKDTFVNRFDTSVGWRLSKSKNGVIPEINNMINIEATLQEPNRVLNLELLNANLLHLEIEDICRFVKYDAHLFRTPIFVILTEYQDSGRCSLGRFVLKNDTKEGYYEELNEEIAMTGKRILEYLIETSVLIDNFKTPERLYPSVIYRYKNFKGKCIYKRTEIYKYGTNGPPYSIALNDFPQLKAVILPSQ